MHRKRAHQAGQPIGDPGRRCRSLKLSIPRAENLRCQHEQGAGGVVKIGLKAGPIGHDLGPDIEQARVDKTGNALARKSMARYRGAEGIGHGMPCRLASLRLLDGFAPPLQANGAEIGLAHLLGNPGKLNIEGVKREEIVAGIARRKQGG